MCYAPLPHTTLPHPQPKRAATPEERGGRGRSVLKRRGKRGKEREREPSSSPVPPSPLPSASPVFAGCCRRANKDSRRTARKLVNRECFGHSSPQVNRKDGKTLSFLLQAKKSEGRGCTKFPPVIITLFDGCKLTVRHNLLGKSLFSTQLSQEMK